MIYPQRDNRRKRRKITIASSIVGGLFVLCVILNSWRPHFFTPAVQAVGEPVLSTRARAAASLSGVWHFLYSQAALVAENKSLKDQLALSNAIKIERDFYKDENATLQMLVGHSENNKKLVIAHIISKPGFSPYDTVLINVGSADGVLVGQSILADENSILGTISSVAAHTSTVALYSTPERETPVFIGSHSVQAIARGKGAGNFEIKLPKNTQVAVGDIVSLASTSSKILGPIEVINTSVTDSFERGLFKNSSDVGMLTYVMVEKN